MMFEAQLFLFDAHNYTETFESFHTVSDMAIIENTIVGTVATRVCPYCFACSSRQLKNTHFYSTKRKSEKHMSALSRFILPYDYYKRMAGFANPSPIFPIIFYSEF